MLGSKLLNKGIIWVIFIEISFTLNRKSAVVRSFVVVVVWSSFFCTYLLYYSSIVLSYMCSRLEKKKRTTGTRRDTHRGHYKGNSSTGTSRTRISISIRAIRARNSRITGTRRESDPWAPQGRASRGIHGHLKDSH